MPREALTCAESATASHEDNGAWIPRAMLCWTDWSTWHPGHRRHSGRQLSRCFRRCDVRPRLQHATLESPGHGPRWQRGPWPALVRRGLGRRQRSRRLWGCPAGTPRRRTPGEIRDSRAWNASMVSVDGSSERAQPGRRLRPRHLSNSLASCKHITSPTASCIA